MRKKTQMKSENYIFDFITLDTFESCAVQHTQHVQKYSAKSVTRSLSSLYHHLSKVFQINLQQNICGSIFVKCLIAYPNQINAHRKTIRENLFNDRYNSLYTFIYIYTVHSHTSSLMSIITKCHIKYIYFWFVMDTLQIIYYMYFPFFPRVFGYMRDKITRIKSSPHTQWEKNLFVRGVYYNHLYIWLFMYILYPH